LFIPISRAAGATVARMAFGTNKAPQRVQFSVLFEFFILQEEQRLPGPFVSGTGFMLIRNEHNFLTFSEGSSTSKHWSIIALISKNDFAILDLSLK
tara:strand:- start:40 stop:327 length:288 start_codon:yes stop_codon:yes gene_type:complete